MSGHSKWSTIKRRKEKTDGERAKIFTKIGRELAVAIREGGGADPLVNFKLKDCIAKAKANNIPNDNIERIIKRAAGEGGGASYERVVYEGYGPSGVAVIVETLTDNRNRTAGDLRHYFGKCGGNMGTPGCVSFMFEQKGVVVFEKGGLTEDDLMELAVQTGADDYAVEDDTCVLKLPPENLQQAQENLKLCNVEVLSAEVAQVPGIWVKIKVAEDEQRMQKLLVLLEDNDDVQEIFHNWEG